MDYAMCACSQQLQQLIFSIRQVRTPILQEEVKHREKKKTGYDRKDTHSMFLRDHQEYRTQKIYIGSDIRTSPVPDSPRNS